MTRLSSLATLLLLALCCIPSAKGLRPSRKWGLSSLPTSNTMLRIHRDAMLRTLRAGASDSEDGCEEDEDEEEADGENEAAVQTDDDEEEEDEDVDDESDSEQEEKSMEPSAVKESSQVSDYDDMLTPSPSIQLYTVIGIMLFSRRLDMFSPIVVRIGRFAFITYIITLQIFLLYVRIKAKSINDRTQISISNPFSKILETTKNDQVKNLASSFLTSQSTHLEYDLAQAKSMNGGLLVNMGFMWFLHFKMGQTQPLFLQTVQGVTNLYFSPLFQVYVLGRNLERPFKNPNAPKLMGVGEEEDAAADVGHVEEGEGEDAVVEADEFSDEDEESDDDTDDGDDDTDNDGNE